MKKNHALLIIDVQNALCVADRATFEAKRVIATINSIIHKARASNAPIIFVQHETASGDFIYGSENWQLAGDLENTESDIYVKKSSSDSFHNTELQARLDSLGVNHLIVCGMQSEFCVDSTVRRALALGYELTVVADGHTTYDSKVLPANSIIAHHNHTWENITSYASSATAINAREINF